MIQKLCRRIVLTFCVGMSVAFALDDEVKSLEKDCNGGNAVACVDLGLMYYNGEGVKQDKSKAKKLFGDACDMGYQGGCDAYRELNEAGVQ